MLRRVYSIKGFDCPNCASKSEAHLAAHPSIEEARIDFIGGKLSITYKDKELSIDEIKSRIAEVEEDDIDIDLLDHKEVVYSCTGFDCAACASKSEEHLNAHPQIVDARIDYLGEKLYVTYGERELSEQELCDIIAEVESDPIVIKKDSLKEAPKKKDHKILFLTLRVAYCLLIFIICGFFFKDLYWLRLTLYISALLVIEYDILAKVALNIAKLRNPLDEYLLISMASIGALVLACIQYAEKGEARAFGNDIFMMEEHFEGVLVCMLWQVGELLQNLAVRRSSKAIENAVNSRVEDALLLEDGHARPVEAKSLRAGDRVLVNEGRLIPIDGEVYEGQGYCDTSSLTGESMPVNLEVGSRVYAGTLLTSGEIKVKTSKDYSSSSSAKILDLIQSSMMRKGVAEKFITKFARFYTPAIFLVALLYIVISGFVGGAWKSSVYSGLEIMVISCPCALVISVPLAYFAAIGLAGKNGIVIKGASYVDALQSVSLVALDKTGTLTKGRFEVVDEVVLEGVAKQEFRDTLVALESLSNHPVAKAILAHYLEARPMNVSSFANEPGLGVCGLIDDEEVLCGNARMMKEANIDCAEEKDIGVYVHVAKGGRYLGYVHLKDQLKENSHSFIKSLQKENISTCILSGDHQRNVASIASELGISSYHAELFPQEKLDLLSKEKENAKGAVAYLGDGNNDAPCLALADVGVAMGGLGADLAVEEADILLLNDDPSYFLKARKVARSCRNVIIFNIAFALVVKVAVMVLAMIYQDALPMEAAVIADTGVSVLLTLNSLLLLRRKI